MQAQHTPGPWESVSNIVRTARSSDGSGGFLVAECPASIGNRLEDARLIAAAPELLAALNAMLTHMGMDEDEWNKPTFDQARAAIAKAEWQA